MEIKRTTIEDKALQPLKQPAAISSMKSRKNESVAI